MARVFLVVLLVCWPTVYAQEKPDMDPEKYLFSLARDIQSRESDVGLARLAPKDQVFFLIWALEAEVNNGGFNQFFFNSSGDHAAATAEALRTIGAIKMAAILDRAINLFGKDGPSRNREQRQHQLTSLSEQQQEILSELDTKFYAYPDNLSELLVKFMRSTK